MESIPNNNPYVLVVDDDTGLLLSIKAAMVSAGMRAPAVVSDSRRVVGLIRDYGFKVVLLDLMMPHLSGLEVLKQIKEGFPETVCVIITAVDDISTAVKAIRSGAYDYFVKPLDVEHFKIVNRALERYDLKYGLSLFEKKQLFSDVKNLEAFKDIVSEEEKMAMVFRQVEAVAPTDYSVFITGESGTGKEMVARAIQKISRRNRAPFMAVNIASLSKTLFEDELFGHTKGAYTNAMNEKKGFFEQADGGTLFLDEIAELQMPLQGKLLRVIEEQELYRLGSTKVRNIDVRIISATNRDIHKEIEKGSFRADLFYRLNMYHIKIPSLRERREDILPLSHYFLKKYSRKNNRKIDSISTDLAEFLLEYRFPGNIRELENIIAGAVLLERGNTLTMASVRNFFPQLVSSVPRNNKMLTLDELEKRHIQHVLNATGGDRKKAAKILGVNTSTVYRKIGKYALK